MEIGLPAAASDTGDLPFFRQLTKANATQAELAHIAVPTTTAPTTINDARGKFRLAD